MFMAYFPEKKLFTKMIAGLTREACTETILLPDSVKGLEAETYCSFLTSDHGAISNSMYTGRVGH